MPRFLHVSAAVLGLATLLAVTACDDDKPDAKDSPSPSKSASASPEEKSSEPQIAPDSTEAGIASFEDYLHALGSGDAKGACAMAQKMFADMKECKSMYGFMFGQMPDNEAEALTKATVDESKVEEKGKGEIFVPETAIVVDVKFSEPFGDYPLYFEDGAWYIREPA